MSQRRLYIATHNRHKVDEITAMLGSDWLVKVASDLDPHLTWQETGESFEENALIKAKAVKKLTDDCVIADDSGLCVELLKGAPGIYSSRFAGEDASDEQNIKKLLTSLEEKLSEKPKAYFSCCIAFIDEQNKTSTFEGKLHGHIIREQRGSHGFGYDPVFIPEGYNKTLAEFLPEEKNLISHRFRALSAWKNDLKL